MEKRNASEMEERERLRIFPLGLAGSLVSRRLSLAVFFRVSPVGLRRGSTSFDPLRSFLGSVFHFAGTGFHRDIVTLQLAIQCRPADAQHSPCESFVSIGLLE